MTERVPNRSEMIPEYCWDLSPLFASIEEWEDLYAELDKAIEGYASFRGRLGESAEILRDAIEFDLSVSRRIDRLFTFAHLKSDEDRGDPKNTALFQRALSLHRKAREHASFLTPEIQAVPEETMRSFRQSGILDQYDFYLEQILRYRPHTLSKDNEMLIAMAGDLGHAPSEIFSQLDNADLRFGNVIDDTGKAIVLSHASFGSLMQHSNREVRRNAFYQYYRAYDEHRNTIAAALFYSHKKDHFYARVRKFNSCRHAALFPDNIPIEVYDNLIETVRSNMSPLYRYLEFRKQALGLEDLHIYDTYVPIVGEISFSMTYEEAVDTCIEALAPLGDEYIDTLRRGLLGGWVDRYENRGKRSGAYSSGCYNSPPYILMNYRDDTINSLYTLAHEAGHSMHSWYSNRTQPYVYHDYTIFVAEVASTLNEILLSRHLLSRNADNPAMTAYIMNREIDNIRATLFRQTMFAEFEKITHEAVERSEPLTIESLRAIYRNLLDDYFGGRIVIDEELTLECLRIPHFYSAFYVYKYATGISAAIALAKRIGEGDRNARDRYLRFLSLGGSMFPLDELRIAGVDMTRREVIEEAIGYFADMVERLAEIRNLA